MFCLLVSATAAQADDETAAVGNGGTGDSFANGGAAALSDLKCGANVGNGLGLGDTGGDENIAFTLDPVPPALEPVPDPGPPAPVPPTHRLDSVIPQVCDWPRRNGVLTGHGVKLRNLRCAYRERACVGTSDLLPITLTSGPDAALVILGTVAASMITLTGIVLTIVLVVVQLAMGQFSPRIVRAILHDRPSQLAIGIFAATFAHAMLAMREISSLEEGAPVPGLAIVVAFVLVVLSIIVLILYINYINYINHIGQSLRVAALIESVGDQWVLWAPNCYLCVIAHD